jgi:hypothetical protein
VITEAAKTKWQTGWKKGKAIVNATGMING